RELLVMSHIRIIEDEVGTDRLSGQFGPRLPDLQTDHAKLPDKTLYRRVRAVQDPCDRAAKIFRPDAAHDTTFRMAPACVGRERLVRYGSARMTARRFISRNLPPSRRAMIAGWRA